MDLLLILQVLLHQRRACEKVLVAFCFNSILQLLIVSTSFLFLVVRPLLLVARPGAPSCNISEVKNSTSGGVMVMPFSILLLVAMHLLIVASCYY